MFLGIIRLDDCSEHLLRRFGAGGDIEQVRKVVLEELDPGRTTGGQHGERSPVFDPVDELGGFLQDRQVGTEVRIEDTVEALRVALLEQLDPARTLAQRGLADQKRLLRKADVVDAGGKGFVAFVHGMLAYVRDGETTEAIDLPDDVAEAALLVPSNRIMVETDAPFLSPEPARKALHALEKMGLVTHIGKRGGWSLTEAGMKCASGPTRTP